MFPPRIRPLSLITIAIVTVVAVYPLHAEQRSAKWLRGEGRDLEIRLQGEVVKSDGSAASDVELTIRMNGPMTTGELRHSMKGNRFELWIPVNSKAWNSLCLQAETGGKTLVDAQHVRYRNCGIARVCAWRRYLHLASRSPFWFLSS
jgi:hypothetical protein